MNFLNENKSYLNDIRKSRPEEEINNKIENLKNQYLLITHRKLSLLNKDDFIYLI